MDITEATLIIENDTTDETALLRSIATAQQALADHRTQVKEAREWMKRYGPITDYTNHPDLFWTQLRAVQELEDYSDEYIDMSNMVTRWARSLSPAVDVDLNYELPGANQLTIPMVRLGQIDASEVSQVATAVRIATRVTRDAGRNPIFLAASKKSAHTHWFVTLDITGETDLWQIQGGRGSTLTSGSLTDVLTYLASGE